MRNFINPRTSQTFACEFGSGGSENAFTRQVSITRHGFG
jgi:hypothetical protein